MSRPPVHGWILRPGMGVRAIEARLGPPMLVSGDLPTVNLFAAGAFDASESEKPWRWSATLGNLLLIADGASDSEEAAKAAATCAAADWLRATVAALEAL